MDKLKLTGDEPIPSTDEESIFIGDDNAPGHRPDDHGDDRPIPVAIPAPGGGGSYPLADLAEDEAEEEGRE